MNSKLYIIDDQSYSEYINGDYDSYVKKSVAGPNQRNEINIVVFPKSKILTDVSISIESELITLLIEENLKNKKLRTKIIKTKVYPSSSSSSLQQQAPTTSTDEDYSVNLCNKITNNNKSLVNLEIVKNKKTSKKKCLYKLIKVESKLVTTVLEQNVRNKLEKKKIFTTKLDPILKYK
jgi:hypothetical protein